MFRFSKCIVTTCFDVFLQEIMFPPCVDVHRVSPQAEALVHGTLERGNRSILTNQIAGMFCDVGQVTGTLVKETAHTLLAHTR